MITSLNYEEYLKLIEENKTFVIDFYASWCLPCKELSKVIDEISKNYSHIDFYKVNIDIEDRLCDMFRVSSVPTMFFVKDKTIVYRQVGYVDYSELEDILLKNHFDL